MTTISRVDVRRLHLPLADPYHLSHTTVEAFDTVLVALHSSDGATGWGETTTLTGYSAESITECWEGVTALLSDAPGEATDRLVRRCRDRFPNRPFSRAAVETAVASLGEQWDPVEASIVGIVSASADPDAMVERAHQQVEAGYDVIKVKIGFDPASDARAVDRLVNAVPDSVRIRADANQGYSWAAGTEFFDRLTTSGPDLVEQPFEVGQLDRHARLRSRVDCEVMLDEEIGTASDVRQAAEAGAADLVKLKLMKQGGPASTTTLAETAVDMGFDVVLGNGVQSDVGCLAEAQVWTAAGLTRAGEFNGWRKQQTPVLQNVPAFVDGALVYDDPPLELDPEALAAHTVQQITYST